MSGSESFAFFYQYVPYQGLLDTTTPHTATGAIEAQGPAITTSAGSGTIINYSMATYGFFTGTKSVYGAGEEWCVENTDWSTAMTVKPGYLISMNTDSTVYMVTEVVSDNHLYISSAPDTSSTGVENFTITALDVPLHSYPNIIDRFPTYRASNDNSGNSDVLNSLGSTIEARMASRVQDILDVPANTVRIGEFPADRGQTSVNIPGAVYGRGNLGIKYDPVDVFSYKKTYQSYLLNKDNSGRLYLMVVGSETANADSTDCKLNAYSEKDSVDIFEIPGRPLLTNRIQ